MTLKDVRKLLDNIGFRYFLAPDREAVMVAVAGLNGRYQYVVNLQADGNFLQFRTVAFLHCEARNPHLVTLLKAMAEINYTVRSVKLAWDASDGEIVAYADLWVFDAKVTDRQFGQTMHGFLQVIDVAWPRFNQILTTGRDPGNQSVADTLRKMFGGNIPSDLPEELRKLLESEGGGGSRPPEPDSPGDDFSHI
jgi:hypothetical protein